MNRKTILSRNFPDFVEKWKRFQNKFKKVTAWYITSDYCLDDKKKPNDVMAFTIFPFCDPYLLKGDIRNNLPKDIKDFTNLSEKAVNYIRKSPYFFTIAFVIEGKNEIFNLDINKQLLDHTIKNMEGWPEKKREEFIHKMKKFRNYLDRKKIDRKTLSDIGITAHIMSTIIEFLMVKAHAKHIFWISDRDSITNFQNGIVHEFIRLGCANLINKRIPDDQMYGFVDAKEYDKEICDDFIRIPDHICGVLASMDYDDVDSIPDKHYTLFDKSIVDNERIYIMHLKHGKNEDTLSDLKFTRVAREK